MARTCQLRMTNQKSGQTGCQTLLPRPRGLGPWPNGVRPGWSIGDYTERQLGEVIRWVKSDGHLYTDDDLLSEAMKSLDFRARGSRIVSSLKRAIAADASAS